MKLLRTDQIIFDAALHTYTTLQGQGLTPVSSVLDTLEIPFDAPGKSYAMAKREILFEYNLLELPTDPQDKDLYFEIEQKIQERAMVHQNAWTEIGRQSMEFGNRVDDVLSARVDKLQVPAEFKHLADEIDKDYEHYYQEFSQFMVFDSELGICGTCDRLSLRGSRSTVVDITDYKTGINKGMTYDNLKEKNGVKKYYNKFYLEPLSHIEISSYARYSLQLSCYAYLLQKMYPEIKIGRLRILFVHRVADENDPGKFSYTHEFIPVFYQRNEIANLFERIKTTKEMMGVSPVESQSADDARMFSAGINIENDIPDY